jgi:predicted porin
MKKTLIALAALAATGAFAQSTVTLSGSINYGVGTAVTGIHSYGNWKGDRTGITIAAVEDLGGGLKVTAAANMRFSSDTSEQSRSYVSTVSGTRGDNLFEQSSIAIDSGMGQVRVGRFTNAVGVAPLHPFEDSGQSTAPHQAANGRFSSQIQYTSPTVGGFQVFAFNAQKSGNIYHTSSGAGYSNAWKLNSPTWQLV